MEFGFEHIVALIVLVLVCGGIGLAYRQLGDTSHGDSKPDSKKGRPKSKWFDWETWKKEAKKAAIWGAVTTALTALYWVYASSWLNVLFFLLLLVAGLAYAYSWANGAKYGGLPFAIVAVGFVLFEWYAVPGLSKQYLGAPDVPCGMTMQYLRNAKHTVKVAAEADNRMVRLYLTRMAQYGAQFKDPVSYCAGAMNTLAETAGGTWIPALPDDPNDMELCYALCRAARNLANGEPFTECHARAGKADDCDRKRVVGELSEVYPKMDPNNYYSSVIIEGCKAGPGFLENPAPHRR